MPENAESATQFSERPDSVKILIGLLYRQAAKCVEQVAVDGLVILDGL